MDMGTSARFYFAPFPYLNYDLIRNLSLNTINLIYNNNFSALNLFQYHAQEINTLLKKKNTQTSCFFNCDELQTRLNSH